MFIVGGGLKYRRIPLGPHAFVSVAFHAGKVRIGSLKPDWRPGDMQKRDAVVSLRDAELQNRLTGGGGDVEAPRENGTGKKHAVAATDLDPIHKSPCNQSKMLVGLDILCLFLGKHLVTFKYDPPELITANAALSLQTP